MNSEKQKLIQDLVYLRSKFNFDFIFQKDNFSHEDIKRYYKKIKYLFYRLAGTWDGFMHIGISDDGNIDKKESYQTYQVEKIAEIIKKNKFTKILELGCGQGANMVYLAKHNPGVSFTGIDLYPSIDKKYRKYDVHIIEGDYHNLTEIKDQSVDLVYAIETLCYSKNKNQIFKEVNRVLKKGGLFIIFDAYLAKPRTELSEIERIGAKLVENGYYLDEFEYVENLDNYVKNNHFKVIHSENMKPKVINHLYDYQKRIQKYLKKGFLFRFICKFVPKEVLGNIVPVYFMADTVEMDLSVYYYHIFQKN